MKNRLLLIRGIPGAGKTTLARTLTALCFSADDFFERTDEAGNVVYKFAPEFLGTAHAQCQARVKEAMRLGAVTIAVHNTFTQHWEMLPYFQLAYAHQYEVSVIHVENRFNNVHGVPLEKVVEMSRRFEPFDMAKIYELMLAAEQSSKPV